MNPLASVAVPTPSPRLSSWEQAIAQPGGYAWWYFDAVAPSGDGLACIFLLGSAFSPAYAARLRRGELAMPLDHCAVNLAIYKKRGEKKGRPRRLWVLSEYALPAPPRGNRLTIGASSLERTEGGWRLELRERTMPWRRRVEGHICVEPLGPSWPTQPLDGQGHHLWTAVAPRARIRAEFSAPDFHLDAIGYHDHNSGEKRLESTFARWGWGRFHDVATTTVVYQLTFRDHTQRTLWLHDSGGGPRLIEESGKLPEPESARVPLRWGMSVPTAFQGAKNRWRCLTGAVLEEAPFYARYRAQLLEGGAAPLEGVGECLDFERFGVPWRQLMLRCLTHPTFRRPIY